jgi:HK97 family phage portal protein
VAYEYSVGGAKHVFDMRQDRVPVLHVKGFHPHDDHYGLSPMQAAASAIDVHNSASTWSKALLDNAARPSGAIIYKGADGQGQLGNDQYSRLIDELADNYQGARNAGRPMLLEGGLDWKPMGFSPSDMEFHRTKEAAARDIALAFGVPPMLLGLPGDNTYANYAEAHRAFYRLTVLPLVSKTLAAVSGWLPAQYGAAFQVKVDFDNVPALAGEREALWRRITGAGFLSDAEKRQLLGLPRMQDGDA